MVLWLESLRRHICLIKSVLHTFSCEANKIVIQGCCVSLLTTVVKTLFSHAQEMLLMVYSLVKTHIFIATLTLLLLRVLTVNVSLVIAESSL